MKLVKDQGYVSVKDYIDSLYFREEKKDWRRKYKQYSAEEQKHIYIQQKEKNDIMLEIGQKSIYFLQKSNYYNTDGTYARLNGPEGEYVEIEAIILCRRQHLLITGMILKYRKMPIYLVQKMNVLL